MANGTGTTKFASNALTTGSSTLKEFASPSLTNAKLMLKTEIVLLATTDTTLKKESASFLTQTMPNHLTLVVANGTGTIRSAYSAQTDGSSTLTRCVPQFLTNAKLMLKMETAHLATTDTILKKENVSFLSPTTLSLPIWAVELGTGTIKSA